MKSLKSQLLKLCQTIKKYPRFSYQNFFWLPNELLWINDNLKKIRFLVLIFISNQKITINEKQNLIKLFSFMIQTNKYSFHSIFQKNWQKFIESILQIKLPNKFLENSHQIQYKKKFPWIPIVKIFHSPHFWMNNFEPKLTQITKKLAIFLIVNPPIEINFKRFRKNFFDYAFVFQISKKIIPLTFSLCLDDLHFKPEKKSHYSLLLSISFLILLLLVLFLPEKSFVYHWKKKFSNYARSRCTEEFDI